MTDTPATSPPVSDLTFAPTACTLPTAERPLRASEFAELLGTQVRAVHHLSDQHVRFDLSPEPEVAGRTADLFTRESQCCSFFTFTLTATGGGLTLAVQVPSSQVRVLSAVAGMAKAATAP
jgi:hypothetical protein